MSTDEAIEYFLTICRRGYGRKLPGVPDEIFSEFAEAYMNAETNVQAAIRASIPDAIRLFILGFGDRLAILADRKNDPILLKKSCVVHSIEDFQIDPRENIMRLILVNHVASKLRYPMSDLLEYAKSCSSTHAVAYFNEFMERPNEINSLSGIELVEVQTPEGVMYQRE